MSKVTSVLLVMIISLFAISGCTHMGKMDQAGFDKKKEELGDLAKSRSLEVTTGSYLGATPVKLQTESMPQLQQHVTVRSRGSVEEVAQLIMKLTPLTVNVEGGGDGKRRKTPTARPAAARPGSGRMDATGANPRGASDPRLNDLLGDTLDVTPLLEDAPDGLEINYSGPLRGLLDQISTQSGYGWDFNAPTKTIIFAKLMTRTFTILSIPGEHDYTEAITNKGESGKSSSSSNSSSNSSSSGIKSTTTESQQENETKLENTRKVKYDTWKDTVAVVTKMLSSEGSVVPNASAGTITVRDKAENLRQIGRYIDETNMRLGRQVAIAVQVWSIDLEDESSAGFDVSAMFNNGDVMLKLGNVVSTGLSSATATLVSGDWKGSEAVIDALKEWGTARQVTSGSAIAMNNRPTPIMSANRISYLAGTSISTTDYGQTTELTPGQINVGFSMTVVPHILPSRRVILSYNINLSKLIDMQEMKSGNATVQLPQTSLCAFSQQAVMKMGQTLVLAGFDQEGDGNNHDLGLISFSRSAKYRKTMFVIAIKLEDASLNLGEGLNDFATAM